MPSQIFELFGHKLNDSSPQAEADRKTAHCPFLDGPCDGGGNRYQTAIQMDILRSSKKLSELDAEFVEFYKNSDHDEIIPGICSLSSGKETWIVCPRRLFGVKSGGNMLQKHEIDALSDMDLPKNEILGIWAEVKVKWSQRLDTGEKETFEYNFDYVVAPVKSGTVLDIMSEYPYALEKEIIKAAKEGDLDFKERIIPKNKSGTLIHNIPILDSPVIIEVMTASTSGSNTREGTNISTVFKKAIVGHSHIAPGINKRQVWGRMGTQLFSKSAAAEQWGGKAYWLLQDQFLDEIERSTRLSIKRITNAVRANTDQIDEAISKDVINLSVFNTNDLINGIEYREMISGYAGLSYKEVNETFLGIILPNAVPPKIELLKAMLRNVPVQIFTIE